jgi:TetR/AcrR family transcriptional regulator, regulator of cefoperazone and chloramphenicol sensitivity
MAESLSALQLVRSALPVFSARGLHGVSTREIAALSGSPMSQITYHFGGKEGLYLACARHIGVTIGALMQGALESRTEPATSASARVELAAILAALTAAIVRAETAEFSRFILREQQDPTEAFDIIYGGVMGVVLERMVALLRLIAGPETDEIELRVRVISLMGQVMAFRVARAAVLRLTGWSAITDVELAHVDRIIQANLAALLDSIEGEHS